MREPEDALHTLTETIGTALSADAVVVRFLDESGEELISRTVWAGSLVLSAQLVGSRRRPDAGEDGNGSLLRLPIRAHGDVVGELELLRRAPFGSEEALLAETAAAQAGLLIATLELAQTEDELRGARDRVLALAGEALAVAGGGLGTGDQLVRLATQATGASVAVLWRTLPGGGLMLGAGEPELESATVAKLEREAGRALETKLPVVLEGAVATVRLGEPVLGALQLVFSSDAALSAHELSLLATFGVRAAHAVRASEALAETSAELERTRALVAVIGQAIAQLSLTHTLETAVDRIAELLDVDRIAVYLREGGRLQPVAGRGLVGPHARVGDRLLSLALGPYRGRGALIIADAVEAESLAGVRGELAESGIEAVLAVPLLAHEEVIGLLAAYPPRGRTIDAGEAALIPALAAQLAVAVENARLHEEAKRLGAELEHALSGERQAARQLRALYEISRSFTHSLSLQATLDAVTRTVVETLGIDAATIRMPDARGDVLEARSVHVADPSLDPLRAILCREQPSRQPRVRRLLRSGDPLILDRKTAASLAGHEPLVPFLERGATGVVVPVATPTEALAMLTLVSLDPSRPIRDEEIGVALSIADQAALAIDNARLYQQQKSFADTMQRSLLPRSEPAIEGLELGAVYESSARVDVGGDVYDFLSLPDGRLAVALGDVTGHGIEAAADMAMAKFVFRSLTREHPHPGEFLASANEVVTGDIGFGKFITLAYVIVDAAAGEIASASAGHPPPRLVRAAGEVVELAGRGLPLGIEAEQTYGETRSAFGSGDALVLYTDGVVEARRNGALYGTDRLDEVLVRSRRSSAKEIAEAILADCRAFGGGDLVDDCAIVVVKKTA